MDRRNFLAAVVAAAGGVLALGLPSASTVAAPGRVPDRIIIDDPLKGETRYVSYYNGQIQETAVWNRRLTDGEMRILAREWHVKYPLSASEGWEGGY